MLTLIGLDATYAQSFMQDHAREHIKNLALSKNNINYQNFSVCYQYGCKKITDISIDHKAWINIISIFDVLPKTAIYERALLAEYVARVEQYIGRKTNTQFDRAGTFYIMVDGKKQRSNQMDCIDESANTLSYLKILNAESFIQFHEIYGMVTRAGLSAGYPHTAVLLIDKLNSERFVIDSWFYDNGRPATIVPYELWKKGWKPSSQLD